LKFPESLGLRWAERILRNWSERTDGGGLDHVSDCESLYGLVFGSAAGAVRTADGLDVAAALIQVSASNHDRMKRTDLLVASIGRSLLDHVGGVVFGLSMDVLRNGSIQMASDEMRSVGAKSPRFIVDPSGEVSSIYWSAGSERFLVKPALLIVYSEWIHPSQSPAIPIFGAGIRRHWLKSNQLQTNDLFVTPSTNASVT
jgi:hypothetical protein